MLISAPDLYHIQVGYIVNEYPPVYEGLRTFEIWLTPSQFRGINAAFQVVTSNELENTNLLATLGIWKYQSGRWIDVHSNEATYEEFIMRDHTAPDDVDALHQVEEEVTREGKFLKKYVVFIHNSERGREQVGGAGWDDVYTFDSLEFLQGIITLCNWLNIHFDNIVSRIFEDNIRVRVTDY